MKKLFLLLTISLSGVVFINAQAAPQTDKEKEERRRQEEEFNRSVDNLRNVGKTSTPQDPNENFTILQSKIKPLYRKPTPEEQKMLAPAQEDLQKYAKFLSKKNTGLIKLIADEDCNKDFNVTVSTPHCLKYTMPGAGSSFSFRQEIHWLRHLGDLNFSGKSFQSSHGVLIHGIMVNIGDVALDEIGSQNKALQTLNGFQPVSDFKKAAGFASLLEKGIEGDGFTYGSNLPVKENSTYLLRSIAYRSEFFRTIDNVVYDELEFDQRKDVTIAFRVVRLNPSERVTLLWKELDKKDAHKF
jgi:hypothetical protein